MELEKRFGDLLANGLGDEGVGLLPVFGGLLARELIQVGEGARWSASQGGQVVLSNPAWVNSRLPTSR